MRVTPPAAPVAAPLMPPAAPTAAPCAAPRNKLPPPTTDFAAPRVPPLRQKFDFLQCRWVRIVDFAKVQRQEEWEKRRTPEWGQLPTTPEWGGGRTPMPDEWRVTGWEVVTATPIGEDEGRWLCIPGLAGKRVDVRVRLKTAGSRVQVRVVIIGPDADGKREHEGGYAETWPNTPEMGNTVWVRFERVPEGAEVEWRKYPVESLCRALNE
ncbi:hypothetical protein B0H16DRAFT_1761338 [Mycena metata]|uniref:Uncharacterized protein n=1 Tax=Mycena metata TaxID=1033252 RepID=A0AAD7MYZ4_9AGAR|nr:hypothetical protein B0H16DRAFT_1761338 [Mycena metata]